MQYKVKLHAFYTAGNPKRRNLKPIQVSTPNYHPTFYLAKNQRTRLSNSTPNLKIMPSIP
jgi:DNA polymerase I-like protein with 3'-5' exonuclease and polymerase domains